MNESLSPAKRRLLAAARQARNDNKFKYVWVRGGRVFVRKDEGQRAVVVNNANDLNV